MQIRWGLDLGTTNSAVARWNPEQRRPELVELPGVCRVPEATSDQALAAPRMVPSCVHLLPLDLKARLGRLPWVRDRVFLGDEAEIGRPALSRNESWPTPAFCPSFKSALSRDPLRTAARRGPEELSAREVARVFVRELLDEVAQVTGERVRALALTVPIEAFEGYRAELRAVCAGAGVKELRFVDEPVAAAIGYGVSLDRPRELLVLDMGGGTFHVARVRIQPRGAEAGGCEVRFKEGHAVGGNLVDRWLLESVAGRAGVRIDNETRNEDEIIWQRLMLGEARRVKEAVHTADSEGFVFTAPDEIKGLRQKIGVPANLVVARADLESVLEARGLYALLDGALERAAALGEVDEVLVVGGSTLLPGVYPRVEARFGRDRVRAWQPFESVALGAAAYASGEIGHADFIVHDYALLTHDRASGAPQHTVIVPRGTRFPTAPDLWRRQLVPTCSMGEPERIFKLVVYELGRSDDGTRFGWDASGTLRPMGASDTAPVAVPLNANNPALGTLDPPHRPDDRRPRLDVAFGVDGERWLVATITDLQTGKTLMKSEPVVRQIGRAHV